MIPKIQSFISSLTISSITEDRKVKLQVLVDSITNQIKLREPIRLNFICTHNSRRSQLAQVWAQTMASYFNLKIDSFSGGVEVTEFNEHAISAMKKAGFHIESIGTDNPHYFVRFSESQPPLEMFSKIYNDPFNCTENFIAIMTCSDADINCPVISGTNKRISLTYLDPKNFDGTIQQDHKYDETCLKIATELYFVFSKLTS